MTSAVPRLRALRFHDDFDGIASAALLLAAFDEALPADCRSVSYSCDRRSWLENRLPRGTAVVDFLFHPDAAIWFDHHAGPFPEGGTRRGPFCHWDPNAPSCAGLVARRFALGGRWAELAGWADKIDSARWDSPQESLDDRIPAVRVYLSLMGDGFEAFAVRLIALLLEGGLTSAAGSDVVRSRAAIAKRLLDAGMGHLREHVQYRDSVAVVECERNSQPYVVPRYGAYTLFPDASYVLLSQQQSEGWKVTLSRNPWRAVAGPHLGSLFTALGGGGHRDVGAINVPGRESARVLTRTVLDALREGSLSRGIQRAETSLVDASYPCSSTG